MKYHKRISVATRYMQIEPMTFRNKLLIGLRDAALREMAITSDWSVKATVAAGTRKEQLKANEARERPPEPVSIRSLEVNVVGDQLQQRETGFKYRARGSRGSGARRQHQHGSMSSGGGPTRSVGPNDCQQCGRSSHGGRTCPAIGRRVTTVAKSAISELYARSSSASHQSSRSTPASSSTRWDIFRASVRLMDQPRAHQ